MRRAGDDGGGVSPSSSSSSFTGGINHHRHRHRPHGDEFMAFVRRFNKEKKYCPDNSGDGDEGGFPCAESRRREAIFSENLADVHALNEAAGGGESGGGGGGKLGAAASSGSGRGTFFQPSTYSDVDEGDFRSRYTNLKPLPDAERARSKAGLLHGEFQLTHSLKAFGFNPRACKVRNWFQSLLSKFNRYRYAKEKHKSWVDLHRLFLKRNKVRLHTLHAVDP